jgi:hypothetical protein
MTHKWQYWDTINLEDWYGFVYKITNLKTGKFYIGKKVFFYNKKKKLTKKEIAALPSSPGRKPSSKVIVEESDWKNYWGSSKPLQKDIKELGEENFQCQILKLCKTKKQLSYWEIHFQCVNEVLICPGLSYNENISGKYFSKDLVV